MPLAHPPGHAQVDFGEAVAVIGGVRQKIHFFCMDLPQSDASFVKTYPAETTEAFLDGHVSAFAFFGGVPLSILYDNLKLAVARILGDGKRVRTRAFTELQSHYLFADRFGRPGKGNDKGKVEGLVKYARLNFLTPVPAVPSFDALNADLLARCVARQNDVLRGHGETIGARMAGDTAVFMGLPAAPFEPCDKKPARVSAFSLVRYRGSDYSVPTRFGHREVLVKGFVDAVVICHGAEVIARHVRSYQAADFVFDPLHYLALLERKTGALDQAAPLQDWDLPPEFATSTSSASASNALVAYIMQRLGFERMEQLFEYFLKWVSMIVRLRRRVGFSLGTRAADDFPEGMGRGCHGDGEEPLGAVSNPACAAAVEAEGKLLEVAVEMFEAHRPLDGCRGSIA